MGTIIKKYMSRLDEIKQQLDELYEQESKLRDEYEKLKEENIGIKDFRKKFICINDELYLYVYDQMIVRKYANDKDLHLTCMTIKFNPSLDPEFSEFYFYGKDDQYIPLREYPQTKIEEITKEQFIDAFVKSGEDMKKNIEEMLNDKG